MKKITIQAFFILSLTLLISFRANAANHDFTNLPLTADGWTDIEALVQPDSRIIYVSTLGSDATGLYNFATDEAVTGVYSVLEPNESVIYPYQTLAAGYAQLRTGYPDFLLLKRGDDWANEGLNDWRKSGRSQTERMILGAYGDDLVNRPKIGETFSLRGSLVSFLILTSIEFANDARSLNFESGLSHVLLEDIMSPSTPRGTTGNAASGIIIQNINETGGIDYLAIRRSVVAQRMRESGLDGYNQGIYINDAENMLLEENIFDQNGRAYDGVTSGNDLRAHNTYIMLGETGRENHIWRGNLSSRASASGFGVGSGGEFYANVSVQDPIALSFGKSETWYDGASGVARQNVILHGIDTSADDKRGWGISTSNVNGVLIEDNIIAGNYESGMPFGIRLHAETRGGEQMYVRNVDINNNIVYDWIGNNATEGYGVSITNAGYQEGVYYPYGSDPDDYITDISITNNKIYLPDEDFRVTTAYYLSDIVESFGNLFYSSRAPENWFRFDGNYYDLNEYKNLYNDTTSAAGQSSPSEAYGLLDYLGSIGDVATFDSYYTKLREQRKGKWDERYMALPIINFVRDKFGKDLVNYSYSVESTAYGSDVDNSGVTNTTDALLTLRNSLGLSMASTAWQTGATTGDVDCNGISNSTDALLILRYSLGLSMDGTAWCES